MEKYFFNQNHNKRIVAQPLFAYFFKRTLTIIIIQFIATCACAQNPRVITTAGMGSFMVPSGVTCLKVQAWGGGGGGGTYLTGPRGGGGGGGYAIRYVTGFSSPVPYTVGSGGTPGLNGSASTFNTSSVIAAGGIAGNATGGNGGSANTGLLTFIGGKGGNNSTATTGNPGGGGGGGGSATSTSAGSVGAIGIVAAGTAAGGAGQGSGGSGGDVSGTPLAANGNSPGGGGGGGAKTAAMTYTVSGTGAAGQIIISWIDITDFTTSLPTLICGSSAAVVTVSSSTLPADTYTITYDLSGANTAAGSTSTMVFSGGTGTFNTSILANRGNTTVTITGISFQGAGCAKTVASGNTANTTVYTVDAGANIATCSPSGDVNISAGAAGNYSTSLLWSSNGSGVFTNNTSADATTLTSYNPSVADIAAGSRSLTLTSISGACTITSTKTITISPNTLQFAAQPATGANVAQDAATSVTIQSYCASSGSVDYSYTGDVTLSVYTGCGYVTETKAAVGGAATFSVVFTRSAQANVQLKATATGFTTSYSNIFNITAPVGASSTAIIAYENFEESPGTPTWPYTIEMPIYSGFGTDGADWTVVKRINNNKSLCKSYTTENGVSQRKSTTTTTFSTISGLTAYTSIRLHFKIGALYDEFGTTPRSPDPTTFGDSPGGISGGSGNDPGEDLTMEVNLDGAGWSPLLSYLIGVENYKFSFGGSISPLSYNGDAPFTQPNTNSLFRVLIPNGTSSLAFRLTASNNRPSENWAIDSIYLTGTLITPGLAKNVVSAAGGAVFTCPNTINTLSVYTIDTYGATTYSWSPTTYITSGANTSNPTLVFPTTGVTYPYTVTATITDADGCYDTGKVQLTIPSGTPGNWVGYRNRDWFQCENWSAGMVPTSAIPVTIGTVVNFAEINPASSFAAPFAGIAYASSISLTDSLWLQPNAVLKVGGNITINNLSGVQYGSVDMTSGGAHNNANTINIGGNWLNSKGIAGFVAGHGKVIIDGTGSQSISTTGVLETFYDLETSKAAGALTLTSPVWVNNSLMLSSGVINAKINLIDSTHGNSLGLLTMDTAAIVLGSPGSTSYVNGQMLKRTNGNNSNEFIFPIGKATFTSSPYQPAGISPVTPTSGTTVTSYSAEFINRNPAFDFQHPFLGSAPLLALLKDKFWDINRTGTGTAKVILNYNTAATAVGDWVLEASTTSPASIPAGTNVAVAHDSVVGTAKKWHFTKTDGNFNTSGPMYEARGYTLAINKIYSGEMTVFSPFTIGFGSSIILPIKLLSFEGRLLGADGSLTWKVGNTADLAGFELEYSTNGQQYKKLASIASNGSTTYGYLHKLLPPGIHYYRLLVKEKNGHTFYSSVSTLRLTQLLTYVKALSGTIIKDRLAIQVVSAKNQWAEASITDAVGRKMGTQKTGLQAGLNQWQLPVALMAKGMYFVTVITADGVKATLPFIKD